MCLMVWVGTEQPVPAVSRAEDAGTGPDGYFTVSEVPPDAPVRGRFPSPHVTYVGSHEGCGCGFNSGALTFEGVESEAELAGLLGALTDEERGEYAAERRSRERLCAIVRAAAVAGPVYVYACWAGDESEPPVAEERPDAGWLLERTAPLEERIRYLVTVGGERSAGAANPARA